MLKKIFFPKGLQGFSFIGRIWDESCRVFDFLPHLVGDLSSCMRTQRYCYIDCLRKIQDLAPRHYLVFLNGLFNFVCARSALLRGLFSSCGEGGLHSSSHVQETSHCDGFSCCRVQALGP